MSDATSPSQRLQTLAARIGRHSGGPDAYLSYGCSFLSLRTGSRFSSCPLRASPKTPPITSTITSKISRIHIVPSGPAVLVWISCSTSQPGNRCACQFSVFFRFRLFQPPFQYPLELPFASSGFLITCPHEDLPNPQQEFRHPHHPPPLSVPEPSLYLALLHLLV